MEAVFSPANWGSPMGLGIFFFGLGSLLAGFGAFIYLATLTDKTKKK